MCKVMKVLVSLVLVLVLSGSGAEAAKKGSSGAQVLKLGAGARACAMGEAFCGLADDTNAVYYNPAGLAQLDKKQLIVMHSVWLQEMNYEFIGHVRPLAKDKTLGISLTYLSSGNMDKLDGNGTKEGSFDAGNMVFSAAYGQKLSEGMLLGASIKGIALKIDNENAGSFALDIGLLSKTPVENLLIGGALQNVGSRVKFVNEGDKLPLNLKIGAAYKVMDNKLILLADINKPVDNDLRLNLGAEYSLVPSLAIRAGYNSGTDEGSGITLGLGYKFERLQLDYTYVPYEDLGNTHRYALLMEF